MLGVMTLPAVWDTAADRLLGGFEVWYVDTEDGTSAGCCWIGSTG